MFLFFKIENLIPVVFKLARLGVYRTYTWLNKKITLFLITDVTQ